MPVERLARSRRAAPRRPGPPCATRRRRRARSARAPRRGSPRRRSTHQPERLGRPDVEAHAQRIAAHRSHPAFSQQFGHRGRSRDGSSRACRSSAAVRRTVRASPTRPRRRPRRRRSRVDGGRRAPGARPAGRSAAARPGLTTTVGRSGPTAPRRPRCWRSVATLTMIGAAQVGQLALDHERAAGARRAGAASSTSYGVGRAPARRASGRCGRLPPRDAHAVSRPRADRRRRSRPGSRATSGPVLHGTDAEQVGAGDEREHGGLRDAATGRGAGHVEGVADDHAVVAEPVAQQPEHRGAQGRRAAPGRGPGTTMWEVITEAMPASTAAANGTSSRAARVVEVDVDDVGSSRWLSCAVSPWPGKCLAQAATPASCEPGDPGGDVRGGAGRDPCRSCGCRSPGCPGWC